MFQGFKYLKLFLKILLKKSLFKFTNEKGYIYF